MKRITLSENPMQIVSEELSKRITSLRYILIVFVVLIHANLNPDDAINYYHYDFVQPYWIEVFKNFICKTLAGAAVSLFFLFASFLQFSKNDSYAVLLKKRTKSLLLPYIIWTCITVMLYFTAQSIPQTAMFFQNPMNIVKDWKILDWVKVFTYYNLEDATRGPLVFQFWFLRDLIIFVIFSPVIKFLCEKLPGFMLIFISILAVKRIPIFFTVSSGALFFYTAGYYFSKYKIDFFKIADKIKLYEYLILILLIVIFDLSFQGNYSFGFLSTIISCLFFLKVSGYFVKKENVLKKLNYLSGFSFFLYAVHMPFLGSTINKLTQKVIPLHGILCLIQFLLAAFMTVFIGTLIGIVLKKICPKLFFILSGGRK